MSRLALTLPVDPREMPTSYLSRLAARNLCGGIVDFACDVGLDFVGIVCGETAALDGLRRLAGLPKQSFARTTVVKTSTMRYRVGREVMNTETLARGELRFCPTCVRAALDGGARAWDVIHPIQWQVIALQRCPEHGTRLRRHRPGGSDRERCYDFTLALVEGRLDLGAEGRDEIGTADALDRYLANRIGGALTDIWCDRLEIPALVKSCEAFGVLLDHGRDGRASQLASAERRACMATGFAVLAEGPAAIHSALDRFNRRTPTRGGNQPHPSHGEVQRLLGSYAKARADFEPLRSVVREYFLDNYPFRAGTIVLGQAVTEPRVLSFRRACRAVKIRGSLLEELLIRRGLATRAVDGSFQLDTVLTPSLIDELGREQRDFLDQKDTVEVLGCSFAMFKQLQRTDILVAADGHGLRRRKGYERSMLVSFLRAVAGRSVVVADAPGHLCTLELATRTLRCNAPDIVRILRDGLVVAPARLTAALRLDSLLVDPRDLARHLRAPKRNALSQIDVMTRLCLNKRTLDWLVAEGFLQRQRLRNDVTRITRLYLTADSVDAFDAKYSTAGVLAREVGVPCVTMQKWLKGGARPIAAAAKGLRAVYRRADAEGMLRRGHQD